MLDDIFCAFSYLCVLLVQTYARPAAIDAGYTQYASNITGKMLSFYESYFGINYQLKKLGKTCLDVTGWMCWSMEAEEGHCHCPKPICFLSVMILEGQQAR